MNFPESSDVSAGKLAALRGKLARLGVDLARVEEAFTKGGGPGGQKINKTANRVVLRYAPLGLTVRMQKDRKRSVNRFLALRELADRIELEVSPATSPRRKEWERLRRQKDRRRRRADVSGPVSPESHEQIP